MEEAYITKGFNNWKKAPEGFVDHQQSKANRAAITYKSVVPQCGDVLEMMVNDLNNNRLAERKYYSVCSTQLLAFRGNDGNGNLTQLFKLLNKNGQHKYIHNDIQNELIELMAKQVLARKLESIRSS